MTLDKGTAQKQSSRPRGGRRSRDKGNRRERAIVKYWQGHGLASERIPLSGSAGGRYSGDLTVPVLGRDLVVEVKARCDGFRELYSWLEGRDLLIVQADRREPLVVVPLKLATEIAITAERQRASQQSCKAGDALSSHYTDLKGYDMATKDDLFPSKWFRASDIPESGLPVRIAKITRERIGPEQKDKPIVHFANQDKALVLNATNFDCIDAALSESDTEKWPGRVVELFATETSFAGKVMPCVRVRKHRGKTSAPAPQPAPEINSSADEADEISWTV
jgi:Holliday junction resolvase